MATSPKTFFTKEEKTWLEAAQSTDSQAKKDAFDKALSDLKIVEKGPWLRASAIVLRCYGANTLRPEDMGPIVVWMHQIQTLLRGGDLTIVAQIVDGIHKRVSALNGATERQRITAWIQPLVTANFSLTHVSKFVRAFIDASCSRPHLSQLWSMPALPNVVNTIVNLCQQGDVAEWLPKALTHTCNCTTKTFWFAEAHFANDSQRIAKVGTWLYRANTVLADDLRKAAQGLCSLSLSKLDRFVQMLTVAGWVSICNAIASASGESIGEIAAQCAKSGKLMPGQKKRKAGAAMVSASLQDMGAWLTLHREVIVQLMQKKYPPAAIAQMYGEELEHRELIAISWFRGTRPDVSDSKLVAMKVIDKGGVEVHGFIFANTGHLAERHLYQHFQFDRPPLFSGEELIKDLNSFFPVHTTQEQISQLALSLKAKDQETVPPQLINGYRVGVKKTINRSRISCLYPEIDPSHRDYFTRDKLTRIMAVCGAIHPTYRNALEEIDWFDAPRANTRP